jgi:hypothetical protein
MSSTARLERAFSCHLLGPVSLRLASGGLSGYLVYTELEYLEVRMDLAVLIPEMRLEISDLERFRNAPFENMIKFVVDVRLKRIALGGEMHADAEEALLRTGSDQADLWGGNLWPWDRPPRIEYISLINIRPSVNNRGMDILLDYVRILVRDTVHEWVNLQ